MLVQSSILVTLMRVLLPRLVYMTWLRTDASSSSVKFDCQINSHAKKYEDYLKKKIQKIFLNNIRFIDGYTYNYNRFFSVVLIYLMSESIVCCNLEVCSNFCEAKQTDQR